MAVNVFLVVFRDYDIKRLRSLDRKYIAFCYGLAAVPAVLYLFLESSDKGKVYGPAIVSNEHPPHEHSANFSPDWVLDHNSVGTFKECDTLWTSMVCVLNLGVAAFHD